MSKNAKNNYRKKIAEVRVELYPTDADIKDRIAERAAAGEAKATYIKRLIRKDIELQKFLRRLGVQEPDKITQINKK